MHQFSALPELPHQSDIASNIRGKNERKNENEDESKIIPNNIITNNENIKSSRNKLITEEMEPINSKDKKGTILITDSEHLNERFKPEDTARKGMLDIQKSNNILQPLKNNENNEINSTIKSDELYFRKENSIKPIEIKSGVSSKNPVISDSKNNTISDFEESFREENVPKQI